MLSARPTPRQPRSTAYPESLAQKPFRQAIPPTWQAARGGPGVPDSLPGRAPALTAEAMSATGLRNLEKSDPLALGLLNPFPATAIYQLGARSPQSPRTSTAPAVLAAGVGRDRPGCVAEQAPGTSEAGERKWTAIGSRKRFRKPWGRRSVVPPGPGSSRWT